jgi:ferric-dicitrate binding protein FerR (iron transport regulator)
MGLKLLQRRRTLHRPSEKPKARSELPRAPRQTNRRRRRPMLLLLLLLFLLLILLLMLGFTMWRRHIMTGAECGPRMANMTLHFRRCTAALVVISQSHVI